MLTLLSILACAYEPTPEPVPPVNLDLVADIPLNDESEVLSLIPTLEGCAVQTGDDRYVLATPDGNTTTLTSAPVPLKLAGIFDYTIAAENEANGGGWYVRDGASEIPPFACRTNRIFGIAPVATSDPEIQQVISNVEGYHKEQQILFTAWGNKNDSSEFWDCRMIDLYDSQILLPLAAWDESAFCMVQRNYTGDTTPRVLFYE